MLTRSRHDAQQSPAFAGRGASCGGVERPPGSGASPFDPRPLALLLLAGPAVVAAVLLDAGTAHAQSGEPVRAEVVCAGPPPDCSEKSPLIVRPADLPVGAWPGTFFGCPVGDPPSGGLHPGSVPVERRRAPPRHAGPWPGSQTALRAGFESMPAVHDGQTAFSFDVQFSRAVTATAADMRDHVFTVTGGSVTAAAPVEGRTSRWRITVTPSGAGNVFIRLDGGRDCGEAGAICTGGDAPLQLLTGLATVVPGEPRQSGTVKNLRG